VRSLGVVVDEPGVEVGLEGLDRFIELLPEGFTEELVQAVRLNLSTKPLD
jgi:hypothetical protein